MDVRDLKWSPAEKKIARRAYEAALESALAGTMAAFKARAAAAATPGEMWAVGDFLSRRRRDINETFDYRYSQLPWVFARLIGDGLLDEAQLAGLSEEKLEMIRATLSFLAKGTER
jgi:hypothetical protein